MPYADKRSCIVDGREILHGEFASLRDKCVVCVDGELYEDYSNIVGGMAGAGAGDHRPARSHLLSLKVPES